MILSDISARRARHVRFARLARALDSERDFPFFFCPVTPQNDSENGKCSFLIGGGRKATNALLFGTHHKRFVVVSFSSEEVRSLPDFSRGFKKRSSRRRVRKKCGDDDDDLTTRFFFPSCIGLPKPLLIQMPTFRVSKREREREILIIKMIKRRAFSVLFLSLRAFKIIIIVPPFLKCPHDFERRLCL